MGASGKKLLTRFSNIIFNKLPLLGYTNQIVIINFNYLIMFDCAK